MVNVLCLSGEMAHLFQQAQFAAGAARCHAQSSYESEEHLHPEASDAKNEMASHTQAKSQASSPRSPRSRPRQRQEYLPSGMPGQEFLGWAVCPYRRSPIHVRLTVLPHAIKKPKSYKQLQGLCRAPRQIRRHARDDGRAFLVSRTFAQPFARQFQLRACRANTG